VRVNNIDTDRFQIFFPGEPAEVYDARWREIIAPNTVPLTAKQLNHIEDGIAQEMLQDRHHGD
jgi:hypothetical protein